MLHALLLLFCFALGFAPAGADAQAIGRVGTTGASLQASGPTSTLDALPPDRRVFVCFLPDLQTLAQAQDLDIRSGDSCELCQGGVGGDPVAGICGEPADPPWCVEPYCTAPLTCKDSWDATHRQIYRNVGYLVTGQHEKIDWSGFSPPADGAATYAYAQDFPRCDLILSLGDMMGIDDADVQKLPQCTNAAKSGSLGAGGLGTDYDQYETIEEFWDIVDASGIPYMPLLGNHEPWRCVEKLLAHLNYTAKPWFYSQDIADPNANGISNTIKVDIAGETFCAAGVADNAAGYVLNEAYCDAAIGCGGDYPTILTAHGASVGAGFEPGPYDKCVNDVNNSEVIAVAGGHWIVSTSSKQYPLIPATGQNVLLMLSNWQFANTHSPGFPGAEFGTTPNDAARGTITVLELALDQDRMLAWDWSEYFHTREDHGDGGGTSSIDVAFPYSTRWP